MMVGVDTNVLVYAHRREADEHVVARDLLRTLASARTPWAIPWPCVYEFFSVVTHPRIWRDAAEHPGGGVAAARVVRCADRSAAQRR